MKKESSVKNHICKNLENHNNFDICEILENPTKPNLFIACKNERHDVCKNRSGRCECQCHESKFASKIKEYSLIHQRLNRENRKLRYIIKQLRTEIHQTNEKFDKILEKADRFTRS